MMPHRSTEYRWYLTGCDRLGHEPVALEAFEAQWQRYEDHAESLKAAEAAGTLDKLDAAARDRMEHEIRSSSLMKAVLVGQSQEA